MTKTAANPTTPAEWEEYVNSLSTPEKFQAAFADGTFSAKLKGYQEARNSTMDDLRGQVAEQVQMSLAEMVKRNGGNAKRLDLSAAVRRPDAPGAKANGIFANLGQFVQDALQDPRYSSVESVSRFRNYSEANPSDGGFLVPEEFRADILSLSLEQAIVRPRATVVPMSSATLKYPATDFTTEVGEVFGGIVMSWLDEGQTITDTSASFALIELHLHKLGGLASVPNELVRDSAALMAWLKANLPAALAHFEDVGFLKGDGVKKPLGALHASNPALIAVAKETNQPAASITWNNVLAMFARMLPESFDNAVWVATPDSIPEIFTMALPVGTGGSAVMIGEGNGSQTPPMTLLGRPIKWTRKAPAVLGTQGDLSLVDFRTYIVGDGEEMRFDTSAHSSFRSDKTDFRIIERVDGQPSLLGALTPENGGPTLSAYVQLATRA